MDFFFWLVACLLGAQLMFVLWNLSQLPKLGRGNGELAASLSILIPARDEEANIGDCLRAACHNPNAGIEILVLDDRSSDGTAEIIANAAKADRRIRYLAGEELPPGWTGKAHACHQLARQASGEWLLFLDADARLAPDAVQDVMAAALRQKRGMITGFPLQVTLTWLEKLVVPMMMFAIACHLPIRLVRASKDARFAAAHGAFVLVHRDSYRIAGGHAANRGHLVDDVVLARAMKKAGEPVMLADIRDQVSMRMYGNAGEVWNGYKKNIFEGVGRNRLLLFGMVTAYSILYVLPPIMCLALSVAATAGADSAWLTGLQPPALLCSLLGIGIKAAVDVRNGQPIWLAPLLPASMIALCGIALASWLASRRTGGGYAWKGRTYS
jgi:glycosyltransferase involved in cell wall biosynthesis